MFEEIYEMLKDAMENKNENESLYDRILKQVNDYQDVKDEVDKKEEENKEIEVTIKLPKEEMMDLHDLMVLTGKNLMDLHIATKKGNTFPEVMILADALCQIETQLTKYGITKESDKIFGVPDHELIKDLKKLVDIEI